MPHRLDENTVARRGAMKAPAPYGVVRGLSEARARRREPVVSAQVLAGLIRGSFGDDPRVDGLAARLANLSSDEALDLGLASDLDELEAMLPEPAEDDRPA